MSNITLEKSIISILENGPLKKSELIASIRKKNSVSVQGIYKALRTLKIKEIITAHEKNIGLSLWWIDNELERIHCITRAYSSKTRPSLFLNLRSGEYIKLRFRTLRELELYWTQTFLMIEDDLPLSTPAYSVIPHDWFYYARPETDTFWLKRQKKRIQRLIVTHPLSIDRQILKIRIQQKMEVFFNENPLKQSEIDYKNILGEFILEIRLDDKINTLFVDWMKEHPDINKENLLIISKLLDTRGTFTMKIIHSPKKSAKIISRLKKYF